MSLPRHSSCYTRLSLRYQWLSSWPFSPQERVDLTSKEGDEAINSEKPAMHDLSAVPPTGSDDAVVNDRGKRRRVGNKRQSLERDSKRVKVYQ
ncbi:hypothetical protein F4804DRAFT_333967 [Jackrogersella minutella]|nr:hypothetical protein F4804DRAFT_333967 [Jackrogersella minutella]